MVRGVALVLCVAGAVLLTLTIRNAIQSRALGERGVIALAEVTSIRADRDTDGGERIAYRLTIDGASYDAASRHIEPGDLEAARAIGRIEVRYLQGDPSVSVPTRAHETRAHVVAFVLSGALTISGLALAATSFRRKRSTPVRRVVPRDAA